MIRKFHRICYFCETIITNINDNEQNIYQNMLLVKFSEANLLVFRKRLELIKALVHTLMTYVFHGVVDIKHRL